MLRFVAGNWGERGAQVPGDTSPYSAWELEFRATAVFGAYFPYNEAS